MSTTYSDQQCERTQRDEMLFHADVNESIDKHLRFKGVAGLDALADKLEALRVSRGFGSQDDEQDDESAEGYYRLGVGDDYNLSFLDINELILAKAIIAKMSVFDLGMIITDLDIDVQAFIDSFDGLDSFRAFTADGALVDPLVLSIGAVQGLALDSRRFRDFQSVAHHSYMSFNALVGSGAAQGYVNSVLGDRSKLNRTKQDVVDLVVGSLTYLNDKSHLPSGSVARYLQATQALDRLILTNKIPFENAWEQVFVQAAGTFTETPLSQEIISTLFSETFLEGNKSSVICLLNNLNSLADGEFDTTKGCYRNLIKIAGKSELAPMFERIHIKLNLMGESVLELHASGIDEPEFAPLLHDISSLGSSLVSTALTDALQIPDEDVGLSCFLLPRLAKLAAGKVNQEVDPALVAAYFRKTLSPHQKWLEIVERLDGFRDERDKILSGYTYLFSLPGVQEALSPSLKDLNASEQAFMIKIGLHPKNIESPSDETLSKIISRDLGL